MDDVRQIGPAAPQSGTTVLDEPPPGHDLEEWRGERVDEPSPRGGGDKTRAERSLLSRIGMRIIRRPYDWVKRPWPDDRVIQVAVTTAALVGTTFAMMLVVHFNPFNPGKDLIFNDVTPTGGDMGAHVWAPAFLRDHLLSNWQLSGWSMDWYGGLPVYRFYMVVPALAIVGLDTILPYGVAFKLIAIFGLVTLPFCAWAFGRLARFRYPIPELFAGAAICFLLNESTTIYGGNVLATMAGEFSFSIAISLMMLGLGLLARGLEDGKGRILAWAAVVLALACLSHGIVLIYTAVAAVVIIACRSGADLWRVLVGVMSRRDDEPDKSSSVGAAQTQSLGTAQTRGLVYAVLCAPALIGLSVVLWQLTDSFVFVVAALALSVIAVAVLAVRVGMASLANRLFVKRLLFGLAAGGLTMLLAAFWVGPFLFDHDYMTDMKYGFQPSGPNESFWKMLFDQEPFLDILINTLAIAGLIGSIARRHIYGIAIGITGLIAVALVYLTRDSLPIIGLLWNPRILPWVYLMRYLMMMIGAVEVVTVLINYFRNRPARQQLGVGANSLVAGGIGLVVLVIFLFVFQVLPGGSRIGDQYAWGPFRSNHGFPDARSDGWPAYNFRGYEGRELYPEYHDVVQTMGGLGQDPEHGCGRALWEIDNRTNVGNGKYGTTMALMLLPYWTDGCIQSMEGLYFEASGSTPYHFLTAAALSKSASNPVRQQRYINNDAEVGVDYALSLGIKYVMVTTPEAYAEAEAQPELELVAESGPWHIYEVRDSAIVEPLDTQPVVVNGRDGDQRECFLEVGTSWFQNQGDWAAMPATDGPDSWQRIDVAIDTEQMDPQGQDTDGCGDPEEIHSRRINVVNPVQEIEEVDLPEVEVTNVEMEQQSVEFDVSEPGVPILVRVSYFPNWKASGAEGPYRIGPNQMVVIPTDTHVELSFDRSNSDLFFYGLTVIGVGLVVFTRFKDWNFPSVTSPSAEAAATPPPPPLPSRIALPELPPPPPSSMPSPAPAPPPDTIELGPVPPGPPPTPPQ